MSTSYSDVPIGIRLIQRYGRSENQASRLYRYMPPSSQFVYLIQKPEKKKCFFIKLELLKQLWILFKKLSCCSFNFRSQI